MAWLFAHLRQQWLGVLALLLLLTGGTAYALDDSGPSAHRGHRGGTDPKLADATFVQAQTVRLRDPSPAGSGDSQVLFRIGRVQQSAFCFAENDGTLRGGIEVGVQQAGATLVAGDFDVDLVPFDVQFINTAASDTGPVATQTPFSVLDRAAVSANGIGATRVDPATGRCIITVHAVG